MHSPAERPNPFVQEVISGPSARVYLHVSALTLMLEQATQVRAANEERE